MDIKEEQIAEDRIYSSRKFVLVIFGILILLTGGIIAVHSPTFAGIYPTFVGGVLGIVGAYITGNVANDFLNNKVKATVQVENIKTNGTSITKETSTIEGPQPSVADLHQDGE